MSESTILALSEESALSVFTNDKLDRVLSDIEKEVLSFVPDISTPTGRKEIASLAYKVSKSKTFLDSAGKSLASDWKSKAKLVDSSRKNARDFLDNLKERVRRPLTKWEAEEKRKTELAILSAEIEEAQIEALSMNSLFDREKVIVEKERIAAENEAEQLRVQEEERIAAEKLEHERRLKEQAAELAKITAERIAQSQIDEAKRLEAEAKAREERIKREAIEAKNKAERDAEQAEINRLQAIEDARIAQELAVKQAQEKAKIENERAEQKAKIKADKLASNKRHMAKINNEALDCFVNSGFDALKAKSIIKLIAQGKISNVTINY